jgi:hypothetical protein
VEAELDGVVASLDERLRESESAQRLERSRLHDERARLVNRVGLSVDDARLYTERVQLRREGETGGPRADDQDVGSRGQRFEVAGGDALTAERGVDMPSGRS